MVGGGAEVGCLEVLVFDVAPPPPPSSILTIPSDSSVLLLIAANTNIIAVRINIIAGIIHMPWRRGTARRMYAAALT